MQDTDPADLIRRAQHKDEAAFEMLVRQHQEAVFRLAYLLLGDKDDAEDAAQETFIRAYKALDTFDAARPLRPWLLCITTNLAYNRRRAVKRYLAMVQRMIWADPDLWTAGKPDSLEWDAQALYQSVRRLSRPDQEIIYLRYFMELSEAETAETLDIAPGTVKSRLHRALDRLRTIVTREAPELWEGRGQ